MLEDPSLIFLFSSLVLLLILSGFFSGSETGMMAANKIKLRNLSKKSKTSAKRALELLKRPDQLLSAILVGNNFANILASAIVTIIMIDYFGGNVLLGSVILTIVILIFSEITPKTMATIKPESFATRSSFILNILIYIFLILFITWFINAFNFMDGIDGITAIQVIFLTSSLLAFNLFLGVDNNILHYCLLGSIFVFLVLIGLTIFTDKPQG